MRLVPALQLALGVAVSATIPVVACSDEEPASSSEAASTGAGGAGGDGTSAVTVTVSVGGPPDAELCGNQKHDVQFDSPALYFVLDASGSMAEPQNDTTRYAVLHGAVVDLVERLGDRVRVGAAVFPEGTDYEDACRPGDEVLSLRLGDPIQEGGGRGPVTGAFAAATLVEPEGGTPTAITLQGVRRVLAAAPGRRAVILVTDGGPNCNDEIACDATTCIPNIEGYCPSDVANCCDPVVGGTGQNCLDRASTLDAIAELRELGITVHVIGIAGSAPFAATLGQMAMLGGAPTPEPPFFQQGSDLDALAAALSAVAVVEGSCVFELEEAPPVTWRTNVWLDADRLPYDSANGWMWHGAPLDYVPVEPPPSTSSAVATVSVGSGGGAGGAGGGSPSAAQGNGGAGGAGAGGAGDAAGGSAPSGGGGGGHGTGGAGPEVDTSAIELRGEACRRFASGEVRRVQIVTGCPTTTPN